MDFSRQADWYNNVLHGFFIFVKDKFQEHFSDRGTGLILLFLSDNHMMKGVVQRKGILTRH